MAIDPRIKYTYITLVSLLFASGIVSVFFGAYFSTSVEARRNAVLSRGNIASLIYGGVSVILVSILGVRGYMNPLRRKNTIFIFCVLMVGILLSCICLGIGVWYQTLTMHDDSGDKWRTQWSYNLRKGFQVYLKDTPCCGFRDPTDSPAATDICFEQSILPGCQDFVFSYAEEYLRNIYTFIFGLTFLDFFAIVAGILFFQARNEEARFVKLAQKAFSEKTRGSIRGVV